MQTREAMPKKLAPPQNLLRPVVGNAANFPHEITIADNLPQKIRPVRSCFRSPFPKNVNLPWVEVDMGGAS